MAISKELAYPGSSEDFEAMCHILYGLVYKNSNLSRVGGPGQKQFGVDILGYDGTNHLGIQCKDYRKKSFTLSIITNEIKKIEAADLKITHLLFATTAANKSGVVKQVSELNAERIAQGKFSISVDFWEDIGNHIRLYPQVGRAYIPEFPGSPVLETRDTANTLLESYIADSQVRDQVAKDSADSVAMLKVIYEKLNLQTNSLPAEQGNEADPRVVKSLNLIRDKLREGKCRDALELLNLLGDPSEFKDQFSRFRWQTNFAFVDFLEGRYDQAADGFINAFALAPHDEKAHTNKTHALTLKNDFSAALIACEEGIAMFPLSETLWALKIHILHRLGHKESKEIVPKDIENNSSILYSLANVEFDNGNYSAAITLIKQCIAIDGGSDNAKRVYLADALSWCALDTVKAEHGQLTKAQQTALSEAVSFFEPLEKTLPAIQSDNVSEELGSNIIFALMLLKQKARANSLVNILLIKHPLLEGLLRVKLQELFDNNDIRAIRDLTDGHLKDLPIPIIGILIQCAANSGDLTWYKILIEISEGLEVDVEQLETFRAFEILANWKSGHADEALKAADVYLKKTPSSLIARVVLAQMLMELGRLDEAESEAIVAKSHLTTKSSSLDVLQVAELLFRLRLFYEASSVYSELVSEPGDDELTKNLLICLVESDQRRKARDILDRLSPEVKERSEFRVIEANLARKMGDWTLMKDLLAGEMTQNPDKANIALHYVGALYRLEGEDAKKELLNYLESDPYFKETSLETEFEFSKYQSSLGLTNLALNRLYRQFRNNSQNVRAASFYLGHLIVSKSANERLAPETVGLGCVVHLNRGSDTRCIAIDIECTNVQSWPELVSSESILFNKLKGLKLGDHVELDSGLSNSKFDITRLESIYDFAARNANDLIAAAAEPTGPVFSVKLMNDDGTVDIEALLESAKRRREHVQMVFDVYKKHRFPLTLLSHFLGTDSITLMLEWPFKEVSFFVGIGTHQERDNAINLITKHAHPHVLDLLTITELVQRKCFESVTKLIGRPLITTTVKDHLMMLLELAKAPQASASLREHDGQLIMTDTPQSYYENRLSFLLSMKESIDIYCDVVVATGPQNVTEKHRVLGEAVDSDSLDVVYLCIERNAILVSEDGAFRSLATEAGVANSTNIQPILLACLNAGLISQQHYSNIVFDKLALGHDFVSLRADDFITAAKATPYCVSERVKLGLETFRKPTLEINSGVLVCSEFIGKIIPYVQVKVALIYVSLVLEVLLHERTESSKGIHDAIFASISNFLNSPNCRLQANDKRKFEVLLAEP